MNELILFIQALMLVAGWTLFLRAQQELKAQAAKQSLAGESDSLRRSIEALLQKLVSEAEAADVRLNETMREAKQLLSALKQASKATPGAPPLWGVEAPPAPVETAEAIESVPAFVAAQEKRFTQLYALADSGRSVEQIARETGRLPGEVELILGLRPAGQARAHRTEGDQ